MLKQKWFVVQDTRMRLQRICVSNFVLCILYLMTTDVFK